MSPHPANPRSSPSPGKAFVAFAVGALVGATLAFPALPMAVEMLLVDASLDTVGRVLVAGVAMAFAVTVGLVAMYQAFALIDR